MSFLITGVVVMMVGFVFLIYFWFVVYISFKQRNGIQTHVLRNSNIYGIYVVNSNLAFYTTDFNVLFKLELKR